MKRAGFRDPEHLPPTGSSTRSPGSDPPRCRRGPFLPPPFRRVAVSRVEARLRPPSPAATGEGLREPGAACRLLLVNHDPRARERSAVPRRRARFLRPPVDPGASSRIGERCSSGREPGSMPGGTDAPVGNFRTWRARSGAEANSRSPRTPRVAGAPSPDPGAVEREGAPTKAPFHPLARTRGLPESQGALGCQRAPRRRYPPAGTARTDRLAASGPGHAFFTCPLPAP